MGPPVVRLSSIRSMPMTFWIPDEISVSNSGWKAETTPPIRACRHCSPARITAIFPASPTEESARHIPDRKSVVKGKSVSVRVDLGGGRNIKKKNKKQKQ